MDNLNFIASIPGAGTVFTQASQAFASSLAIDTSVADIITVILTGSVTSMTLNYGGSSTIPTGQRFWLRFVQNATGGWTVVFPPNLHFDQNFAVDPGANRITILPMRYNGANWEFFEEPFSLPG